MSIASHLTLTLTRVLACVVVIITLLIVLYSLNVALQYPAAATVYSYAVGGSSHAPAGRVGVAHTANHTLSDRPNRGEQWYMTRGQPERSGRR